MPDLSLLERLKQRKIVQRGLAYLAGAFVVFQAVEVMAEPWGISPTMQRIVHVLLLVGFFVQLVLAWYHGEQGRQRISGMETLMLGVLLLIAGLGISLVRDREAPLGTARPMASTDPGDGRPRIAVLPCENFSANAEDAHLAAGLHDQILLQLQKISSLFSIGRKSVEWYIENPAPPSQIARELGVGFLGECSVQKEGDRIRLTFQLFDGNSQGQLWAENYDEALTANSLFEIQSDIALKVARGIGAILTPEEEARIESAQTENLEAYDLYLLGRRRWTTRSAETLREAISYFERAIDADSTFALAYSGLADSYAVLPFHDPTTDALDILDAARSAARKALELDPDHGEVHASVGFIAHVYDWDPVLAEEHLSRAVELAPGYANGLGWYSNLQGALGRYEEAAAAAEKALAMDPLSNVLVWFAGERAQNAGSLQLARVHFARLREMEPPVIWGLSSFAWNLATFDPVDAEAAVQVYSGFLSSLGYPFPGRASEWVGALTARDSEARRIAGELLEDIVLRTPFSRADLILEYSRVAPADLFFSALEEAVEKRHFWVVFVPTLFKIPGHPQRLDITQDVRWNEFLSEFFPASS